MLKINVLVVILIFIVLACDNKEKEKPAADIDEIIDPLSQRLGYIGEIFYEDGDTIYHQISPFGLTNQHGDTITHKTVEGKIYLADFFFTSCGGQCPHMTAALKRVQQNCKDIDFLILSHTIDPKRDTAETFIRYIEKYGLDDYNWHFLTGDQMYIKGLGEESYLAVSGIDAETKGVGDLHSPHLYLIDKNRHIRGVYDGTDSKEVDKLIEDLRLLASQK